MTSDKNALGVLRSALWGQAKGGRQERIVTWETAGGREGFRFSGGIIRVTNRPLGDIPELAAIRTRIASLHLLPTNTELAALMRHTALSGHVANDQFLPPQECMEVCEFVIKESLSLDRNLDMRLLVNAFADRLQWKSGDAETNWEEMVASRLQERVLAFERPESRAERKRREQQGAAEVSQLQVSQAERERMWTEQTRKSARAYYRRLEECRHLGEAAGGPEAKAG